MLSYDLHRKDQEVAAGTLLPRTGLHTELNSRCMYLIINNNNNNNNNNNSNNNNNNNNNNK